MSSDTSTTIDPFAPTALDEETELRALAQALKLAQGFKLIFARCNQLQQRKHLIAALRKSLGDFAVQEIHFTGPVTHLLDELRERMANDKPQALFVSGLEYSLPAAAEAHKMPFIANLNASRNSFPEIIPFPLVLWVPEYILNAIILGAPDFYSIRSGTYFFAASPGDTREIADDLISGPAWMTSSLTLAEKQERIQAIKSLLSDYESLPSEKRNPQVEMRLHFRLGILLRKLGWIDSAERHFKCLSDIAKEEGDKVRENLALLNLGNIYEAQRKLPQAQMAFKQCIEGFRAIGNRSNEAAALCNLGILYTEQEQWKEAEEALQQSLEISRELSIEARERNVLNSLGKLSAKQHQFSEAEKYYQQSLSIAREIKDRFGEGVSLTNLGALHAEQGRLLEASTALQQGVEIARQLGAYINEAVALSNLALLQYEQGDIKRAIDFQKQAVKVLENTQNTHRLDEAKALLKALEREAIEPNSLET